METLRVLRVTSCRLALIEDRQHPQMKAIATITLEDQLVINGLKVIEGQRMFVAMPSRRRGDGEFYDEIHPLTPELRREIEAAVMEQYERQAARRAVA